MKKMIDSKVFGWLLALVIVATPEISHACAVCYGEPDSPAAKGLTWAIVVLGGLIGMVLSGIVVFFVHASRGSGKELAEGE